VRSEKLKLEPLAQHPVDHPDAHMLEIMLDDAI